MVRRELGTRHGRVERRGVQGASTQRTDLTIVGPHVRLELIGKCRRRTFAHVRGWEHVRGDWHHLVTLWDTGAC